MLKQHLGEKTTSNMLSTFRPFVFNIWTGRGRNRSNPRRRAETASQRGPRRRRNHPIFACDYANPRLWVAMDTDLEVHRDRDTSVVVWPRTLATIQFQTSSLFAYIAITAFRCIAGARSAPGDFFKFSTCGQHLGPISEINISTCGQHLGGRSPTSNINI